MRLKSLRRLLDYHLKSLRGYIANVKKVLGTYVLEKILIERGSGGSYFSDTEKEWGTNLIRTTQWFKSF